MRRIPGGSEILYYYAFIIVSRKKIEITPGFLLVLAWINYLDAQAILPVFLLSCMIHEAGHLLALVCMGKQIKAVKLSAAGAEIAVDDHLNYPQEGVAALMGPGINLLAALFFSLFFHWDRAAGVNLGLGVFNLLPVRCLDGGRALFCTVATLFSGNVAEILTVAIDMTILAVLFPVGIYSLAHGGNGTLLMVSLLIFAMRRERHSVRGKSKRIRTDNGRLGLVRAVGKR